MCAETVTYGEGIRYRKGVGMMLLDRQGRVFVAKRIDTSSEAWQMPQGGIDEGEEPRATALRELQEEIGTDQVTFIAESRGWFHYDLPPELAKVIWAGYYRGQVQKWFLLRFDGSDSDINILTEKPEFCEWRWAEAQSLPDLIVPFKRQLYCDLLEEFREYLP